MYVDSSLGAPTHVDLSLGAAGCMILVRSSTILVQERGRVAVTNQRDVHEQKSERPLHSTVHCHGLPLQRTGKVYCALTSGVFMLVSSIGKLLDEAADRGGHRGGHVQPLPGWISTISPS